MRVDLEDEEKIRLPAAERLDFGLEAGNRRMEMVRIGPGVLAIEGSVE